MSQRGTRFAAVCFDFDSTLSRLEGIDELAVRAGVVDDIVPLTVAAMEGAIPLEQVYGRRLEIIRPGRDDIAWLADRYLDEMVGGVAATLAAIRAAGAEVFIISGGIRGAILPFAAAVGIPADNVYAVEVSFDADGAYHDFDHASPLTRADGKARICAKIQESVSPIALVGDGATDMAAKDVGAYVIGFGGVAARDAVRAKADAFVESPDLTAVLGPLGCAGY